MRVPPMSNCGLFGVRRCTHSLKQNPQMIKPIENDKVTFSSQIKYLKLYNTLPEEIKQVLSPQDAVYMFQSMEDMADGWMKAQEVAKGGNTDVYENPWLPNYYIMVTKDNGDGTSVVYTETNIGSRIWQDPKDARFGLLKKAG